MFVHSAHLNPQTHRVRSDKELLPVIIVQAEETQAAAKHTPELRSRSHSASLSVCLSL